MLKSDTFIKLFASFTDKTENYLYLDKLKKVN